MITNLIIHTFEYTDNYRFDREVWQRLYRDQEACLQQSRCFKRDVTILNNRHSVMETHRFATWPNFLINNRLFNGLDIQIVRPKLVAYGPTKIHKHNYCFDPILIDIKQTNVNRPEAHVLDSDDSCLPKQTSCLS